MTVPTGFPPGYTSKCQYNPPVRIPVTPSGVKFSRAAREIHALPPGDRLFRTPPEMPCVGVKQSEILTGRTDPGMPPTSSHQLKIISMSAGLLLLVVFTYLPVRNNDFIFYDDPGYVTGNPHVQAGLTWGNLPWAFRCTVGGIWHPLAWLSHMVDCQLFGLNPQGHHLMSLFIHALNAILVFVVLEYLTGAVGRSFFVAALFGLHPTHVESVAWVSERKDVLCATFWLLSLWLYAGYARRPSARGEAGSGAAWFSFPGLVLYGFALLCFVLSLMSKPMVVTLPFILLLLDFWPLNRFPANRPAKLVLEKVPFLVLSTVICLITIPAQKAVGGVRTMAHFSLPVRIENVPVSYCRYLGKLFWPANLPFFYPHPGHWPLIAVLAATLLVLGLSVLAWVNRRERPYLLVGWGWFLGSLVPVIGLVQVGFQSIANRYTYMPFIGIFLALAWGARDLTRLWRHRSLLLGALATAAILICIPLTRIQIGYWKNSEILFQYASVVIENNWEAHARLGLVFSRDSRLDEAIKEYREALRLKPDDADAHYDLANALYRNGLLDEAIREYRADLQLSPNDPEGHNNLGAVLFQKGNRDEAIAHFQEALRLKPDYTNAKKNLATAMTASKPGPAPAPPANSQ
jgi:protein O-mannosyl-transferase